MKSINSFILVCSAMLAFCLSEGRVSADTCNCTSYANCVCKNCQCPNCLFVPQAPRVRDYHNYTFVPQSPPVRVYLRSPRVFRLPKPNPRLLREVMNSDRVYPVPVNTYRLVPFNQFIGGIRPFTGGMMCGPNGCR